MFVKNRYNGTYIEVDVVKQTIELANTVNLLDILYGYNFNIDKYNRKICCPFPFHKNGHEQSASFYFYSETNSFFCFGCKSGGGPVEFVSLYENVNKYQASLLINNSYATNIAFASDKSINYDMIYLEFSHLVREFILLHKDNYKALVHAEKICIAFDTLRSKYILDPEGLEMLVSKLQITLKDFNECLY